MLLRCCLIHIPIIILRQILFDTYLCPCLGLGLFMSCLRDRFFIFSNLIKTGAFIFVHFLVYFLLFWDDNVDEESEKF